MATVPSVVMVRGTARARAGQRDALLVAAAQVARASRDDDGCLSYGFFTDIEDPDVVMSLEVWRDESALAAHMRHPHTLTFLAAATELVDGAPEMSQHAIDAPAPGPTAGDSAAKPPATREELT